MQPHGGTAGTTRRAKARWSRLIVAVIAAVAGTLVLTPQPAMANPTQIVNSDIEDGCLSANYQNDVYIATCSGVRFHQWTRVGAQLRNVGTGRCLSANNAGSVYTAACRNDGFDYHEWLLTTSPPGASTNKIQNNATRACLSASYITRDVYTVGGNCGSIAPHRWYLS